MVTASPFENVVVFFLSVFENTYKCSTIREDNCLSRGPYGGKRSEAVDHRIGRRPRHTRRFRATPSCLQLPDFCYDQKRRHDAEHDDPAHWCRARITSAGRPQHSSATNMGASPGPLPQTHSLATLVVCTLLLSRALLSPRFLGTVQKAQNAVRRTVQRERGPRFALQSATLFCKRTVVPLCRHA